MIRCEYFIDNGVTVIIMSVIYEAFGSASFLSGKKILFYYSCPGRVTLRRRLRIFKIETFPNLLVVSGNSVCTKLNSTKERSMLMNKG